jgi:hypothetical protein
VYIAALYMAALGIQILGLIDLLPGEQPVEAIVLREEVLLGASGRFDA